MIYIHDDCGYIFINKMENNVVDASKPILILGIARPVKPLRYVYKYEDSQDIYIENGIQIASHHPHELLSYYLRHAKFKK